MSVEILGFEPKEAGIRGWHLRSGDKELDLFIHADSGVASSHIHNIGGNKVPGTTTLLHSAALDIMEDMASRKNRPIHYSFATSNPKMREWALDENKGAGVFR